MKRLFNFITAIFLPQNYTLRNFAIWVLFIMCIQYIPLESRSGVSPVKVITMGLVPIVMLVNANKFRITKALMIGMIYYLWVFFTAFVLHPQSFRASTVLYLGMFVITYIAFYNFVWVNKIFTLDSFIRFIRWFLLLFAILQIVQQISILLGFRENPLINLCQVFNDRALLSANSISYEPSTSARTMGVLYYIYLKCHEYKQGYKLNISSVFNVQHRAVTLLFIWSMLTMGSGTAFICLAILSLYFMRGVYFMFAIPIFVGTFFVLSYFEVQQFERAKNVVVATSTGDAEEVIEEDGSAATRIAPMLNTFSINLSKAESWVGEGCDSALNYGSSSNNRYVGNINDYGMIAYILSLILVFSCAIRFRSLATIMFFTGVGGGIGNIAYGWGLLLLFTCLRYLYYNRD